MSATPADTTSAETFGTLTYPISPDYVKSWTPVRGLCELIANALDEDPRARVTWADGVLTIADDGPGIPEEGLILGYSDKTNTQIGQFGEGKKIACLVLARAAEVGAVRFETVGYGFTPRVQRRRLLDGRVPSRSGDGVEVLVYELFGTDRTRGTVITVECPQAMADEAINRFRALADRSYTPPTAPGEVLLDGQPGRVWIGGVLVSQVKGLVASYDLPLDDKALQNRDRTVIEADALRRAVRTILASSCDPDVIDHFARLVLGGGRLREQELFFSWVTLPRVRAAWRTWARAHLPERTFYTLPGSEEAALNLVDRSYVEVRADGLSDRERVAFMDLLGVEVAREQQKRHYEKTRNKTTWVPERDLTDDEAATLRRAVDLVRRAIGPFALDRVRVYIDSEEIPCALGLYTPSTGDVGVQRDLLTDGFSLLSTLLHEAAHRVAHRGGGRWTPREYADRTRGFESVLSDFSAVMLTYLADGRGLPEPAPQPQRVAGRRAPAVRYRAMDDPSVPATRRELAHLLTDRLPAALEADGFADVKDMVASTGVHPEYWRVLTNPKVAGYRAPMSQGGRAWDYDKVALLAEAVGLYPPVVWLGYNICEGPIHGRPTERRGAPGPWAKKIREATLRACADLEALGGVYATAVQALHALVDGTTPAPLSDESWQEPVRALIAAERHRLGLDTGTQPAAG